MKRLKIILILIICIVYSCDNESINTDNTSVTTDEVSIDLASDIALQFSNNQKFYQSDQSEHGLKSNVERKIKDSKVINDDFGDPLIFVFNYEPSGFVMISGTKKTTPVLAYSDTSVFDIEYMNSSVNDWILVAKQQISYLKNAANIEVSELTRQQWDMVAPPEGEEVVVPGPIVEQNVGPLLQTTWGQGVGYNEFVPVSGCSNYSNGKAPTGCVATATAQVMRYWGYPERYKWESMPDIIIVGTFNPTGATLISGLMHDIGAALNMAYSCSGSAAYTSDVPSVLKNIFGYTSNSSYINFDLEKVVQQIDLWRYPVIMRGQDPSAGGHAWVCDGYQRTKYIEIHNPDTSYEYETATYGPTFFHMNWGWNGTANGWYRCNDFTPSIYEFSDDLKCIIFIHP